MKASSCTGRTTHAGEPLALGDDARSAIATVRGEPGVYGLVASDATASRTIAALPADPVRVLAAIDTARQHARTTAWGLAGAHAPDAASSADAPLVIELDATLSTAHSEKERAAATFKRGWHQSARLVAGRSVPVVLDLTGRSDGMWVTLRWERPHPGAQLRFDDVPLGARQASR